MIANRFRLPLVTLCVGFTLIAGVGLVNRATSKQLNVSFTPHPAFAAVGGTASISDVAERVMPSVVNIASTQAAQKHRFQNHPFFRDFFGPGRRGPKKRHGMGSGVIVRSDGIVITNNHVVAKADKIRVTLSNKREYEAKVLGTDPKSDVAVLKLKGAKGLRPISLANSDKIRLGHVVLAVGNPFGVGQTVTMGIISAKGRANVGIVDYEDFIQTDAAINPGNSGGALVDMNGQLIGINTAILSRSGGYQGIGFAIPTNMVRPIMNSLMRSGKVVRGWLGVAIQSVTPAMAKAMKLGTRKGVLISDVDPSGPARKAGLKRGDVVLKIDGRAINSTGRLRNAVASAGAKRQIRLEFMRQRAKKQLKIKLAELPARLGGTAGAAVSRKQNKASGGVSVAALTRSTRNRYKIPKRIPHGVVVTKVAQGAAARHLRPGDVILEVNRATIKSVSRFTQLFSAARGQVLLLVFREGYAQYLLIHK